MFDHWRLLRGEKAVKLMVPKDPNDIAREKRSYRLGLDTKRKQGCFVRMFRRGFRAVKRHTINIYQKGGIS